MFAWRHLIEALINPFFITFLLFTLSLLWFYIRGDSRTVRIGFLLVFIGLLLFSTGWLPRWVTHKLEKSYPAIIKVDPSTHWVVVFGGGHASEEDVPKNSLLTSASIKRLLEGVRLYRQLPDAKLLLSGGGREEGASDASFMATLAYWFSIPEKNILLETDSINTADEAVLIKKWVHDEPFYLVTSAIHMPRAMALCRRQGLNPIAAPTDFTDYCHDERCQLYLPSSTNLVYFNIAWHEILGWVWGKIVGQI